MSYPLGYRWLDEQTFEIVGELDGSSCDEIRAELAAYMENNDHVRIHCAGITFCDSSGLEALLRPAIDGHRVTLVQPSPFVARLLTIADAVELPGLLIDM